MTMPNVSLTISFAKGKTMCFMLDDQATSHRLEAQPICVLAKSIYNQRMLCTVSQVSELG